jgi:hypothetical protein
MRQLISEVHQLHVDLHVKVSEVLVNQAADDGKSC